MDKDRLKKLPKWAQELIQNTLREVNSLRSRLKTALAHIAVEDKYEYEVTWTRDFVDNFKLPEDAQVDFKVDKKDAACDRLTVYTVKDPADPKKKALYIYGHGQLVVRSSACNVLTVSVRRY